MNDLISRAAAIEAVTNADRNCLGAHGALDAIRALPAASQPEAEPVAWRDMEIAPRDGTWFWAETAYGQGRWVHFADRFDRYPIDHEGGCWSTEPVRWRADFPATPAPVVPAEGLEVTEAMVDAAFGALPADAHGTIGSGEMERVLKAAFRAGRPMGNDHLRAAAGAPAEVIDQHNHKGPLPDEVMMMCWLRAQDVVAALRSAPPVGARVKPLVWSKGVVAWARPLPGMKYVACSTTPTGSWAFWLEDAPETRTVFSSEEAAKAAAQADFEARILAALLSAGEGE